MDTQAPLSPDTTAQQDITTAGQRKINLIWEYTQASIAILVTMALIYTAITKVDSPEIRDAFFLIVGFYFSRTNHAAIGGVGPKPLQKYEGR
jgi:hypothetical protein